MKKLVSVLILVIMVIGSVGWVLASSVPSECGDSYYERANICEDTIVIGDKTNLGYCVQPYPEEWHKCVAQVYVNVNSEEITPKFLVDNYEDVDIFLTYLIDNEYGRVLTLFDKCLKGFVSSDVKMNNKFKKKIRTHFSKDEDDPYSFETAPKINSLIAHKYLLKLKEIKDVSDKEFDKPKIDKKIAEKYFASTAEVDSENDYKLSFIGDFEIGLDDGKLKIISKGKDEGDKDIIVETTVEDLGNLKKNEYVVSVNITEEGYFDIGYADSSLEVHGDYYVAENGNIILQNGYFQDPVSGAMVIGSEVKITTDNRIIAKGGGWSLDGKNLVGDLEISLNQNKISCTSISCTLLLPGDTPTFHGKLNIDYSGSQITTVANIQRSVSAHGLLETPGQNILQAGFTNGQLSSLDLMENQVATRLNLVNFDFPIKGDNPLIVSGAMNHVGELDIIFRNGQTSSVDFIANNAELTVDGKNLKITGETAAEGETVAAGYNARIGSSTSTHNFMTTTLLNENTGLEYGDSGFSSKGVRESGIGDVTVCIGNTDINTMISGMNDLHGTDTPVVGFTSSQTDSFAAMGRHARVGKDGNRVLHLTNNDISVVGDFGGNNKIPKYTVSYDGNVANQNLGFFGDGTGGCGAYYADSNSNLNVHMCRGKNNKLIGKFNLELVNSDGENVYYYVAGEDNQDYVLYGEGVDGAIAKLGFDSANGEALVEVAPESTAAEPAGEVVGTLKEPEDKPKAPKPEVSTEIPKEFKDYCKEKGVKDHLVRSYWNGGKRTLKGAKQFVDDLNPTATASTPTEAPTPEDIDEQIEEEKARKPSRTEEQLKKWGKLVLFYLLAQEFKEAITPDQPTAVAQAQEWQSVINNAETAAAQVQQELEDDTNVYRVPLGNKMVGLQRELPQLQNKAVRSAKFNKETMIMIVTYSVSGRTSKENYELSQAQFTNLRNKNILIPVIA